MAILSSGLLVAALLLALPPVFKDHAPAQQRPVTFIVGAGAGSVFDNYTRTLARHIGRHLPDRPKVVVRNLVGGGGSVAAEYLYREAKPDGRTVGNWPGGLIHKQIYGSKDVKLDTRRFAWVGAIATLHPVCVVTQASGIGDLAAWSGAKKPVKLGGIGRNDAATNMSHVFGTALGLPITLIDGYRGPLNVRLAAGNEEVQGGCWYWQAVKKAWRKMLAAGNAKVVLQAMTEPHADLPSVPNALDLAKSEEARMLLMYGVQDPAKIARAYSLPPGTPKEQVAILRKAFADTVAEPSFVAEAKSLGLEIRPLGGAEIEKTVQGLFKLSPKHIVQLRKVLFPEQPGTEDRTP